MYNISKINSLDVLYNYISFCAANQRKLLLNYFSVLRLSELSTCV